MVLRFCSVVLLLLSGGEGRNTNHANRTKHSMSLLPERKKKGGIAHFAHSNVEAHFVSVSGSHSQCCHFCSSVRRSVSAGTFQSSGKVKAPFHKDFLHPTWPFRSRLAAGRGTGKRL